MNNRITNFVLCSAADNFKNIFQPQKIPHLYGIKKAECNSQKYMQWNKCKTYNVPGTVCNIFALATTRVRSWTASLLGGGSSAGLPSGHQLSLKLSLSFKNQLWEIPKINNAIERPPLDWLAHKNVAYSYNYNVKSHMNCRRYTMIWSSCRK